MARRVTILDGEVTRHFVFVDREGKRHIITLVHDVLSGARACLLDYEPLPGSEGTTSLLHPGRSCIPFQLPGGETGYVEISRHGLLGFRYRCELQGRNVLETTAQIMNTELEFEVTVPSFVFAHVCDDTALTARGSHVANVGAGGNLLNSGDGVAWYELVVRRRRDGAKTRVHRRFRDFAALYEQADSMLKGHHLRSSLPTLPSKHVKVLIDHTSKGFTDERREQLQEFLRLLLPLPHIGAMDTTRAFLGLLGNTREYSVLFKRQKLGLVLQPGATPLDPPIVASVQAEEEGYDGSPYEVRVGDGVSKIAGAPLDGLPFPRVVDLFNRLPRPLLIHFLQEIVPPRVRDSSSQAATAAAPAAPQLPRTLGGEWHDYGAAAGPRRGYSGHGEGFGAATGAPAAAASTPPPPASVSGGLRHSPPDLLTGDPLGNGQWHGNGAAAAAARPQRQAGTGTGADAIGATAATPPRRDWAAPAVSPPQELGPVWTQPPPRDPVGATGRPRPPAGRAGASSLMGEDEEDSVSDDDEVEENPFS